MFKIPSATYFEDSFLWNSFGKLKISKKKKQQNLKKGKVWPKGLTKNMPKELGKVASDAQINSQSNLKCL